MSAHRETHASQQPDYTSRVARFTFPNTLEEQVAQLETNPLVRHFAQTRAKLAQDPHRPIFHYVNPEGTLNDPNGLCFWQGRWHLFYQAYPPEDRRQHWGHAVSEDLVHWRDLPYAIYPHPEEKCYSGSALVEDDQVIAMYHGTQAGNMIAVASDPLLLNWEKVTGGPVIPMTSTDNTPLPYEVYDPCIWKKGEEYFSISGGQHPLGPAGKYIAAAFLFRSKDLETWEYLHPFTENDRFTVVGDDYACPYFWPIGDRHILLFFSHMSGGQYLLGDYAKERDKFIVTSHGKFNFGASQPAGVHAPSAAPDDQGGVVVIFNMNAAKPTKGWNQIMSLPRRLTLLENEKLRIEPAGDLTSLRSDHQHIGDLTLPANEEVVFENVRGNAMELDLEIAPSDASVIELNVLRSANREEFTRIAFFRDRGYLAHTRGRRREQPRKESIITLDSSHSSVDPESLSRPPESAPIILDADEPLRLRVFIDKSVVEVFANERQCVALRVYPERPDSVGVSLRSQGRESRLRSLDAWHMRSI